MPIIAVKDWSFETMDYNRYHHVINQERILWFAMNYSFSSEYKLSSSQRLILTSFSSKKMVMDGVTVNAILVYNFFGSKCPYNLEIFPDEDKYWKTFCLLFDVFISADHVGNKALRYLAPIINNSNSKK
jgi:hypothetical protein